MSKQISDERAEEIVAQTVATMEFEGLYCTEDEIQSIRRIAKGETTADAEVDKVIKDFYKGHKNKNV